MRYGRRSAVIRDNPSLSRQALHRRVDNSAKFGVRNFASRPIARALRASPTLNQVGLRFCSWEAGCD